MNTRRIKSLLLLTSGVVLGFGLAVGGAVLAGLATPSLPARRAAGDEQRVLAEVMDRIRREYVDAVPEAELVERAARGLLTSLDAHSQFLDATEYEEIRISTTGNYTGVGLEVRADNGAVVVVAPIADSAAARAGLRSGDVLLRVDGLDVSADRLDLAIQRLRGAPGTPVVITARRGQDGAAVPYHLLRGPVQMQSVQSRPLPGGFGYAAISQFNDRTAADLARAIQALRARPGGLRGLVLDLRDNPGGVLDAAVAVSDAFLDRGVIVTASGRTRDASFRFDAVAGDQLDGAPMVVLVNGSSASAAEIVAGALKDHGRATLLGERSFGKGSVQTVLPLSDGRAIKLTTSRYATPSGLSIQSRGVEPDVVLAPAAVVAAAGTTDAGIQAALRLLNGEPPSQPLQTRALP